MDEENAIHIVYTEDEDFILNRKDLENLGGGGGSTEIPIASASVLGGVKVGSGLAINAQGVLSASGGGGGGGGLVTNLIMLESTGDRILDKTAGEIMTAINSGNIVYMKHETDARTRYSPIVEVVYEDEEYTFETYSESIFTAATLNDYPIKLSD